MPQQQPDRPGGEPRPGQQQQQPQQGGAGSGTGSDSLIRQLREWEQRRAEQRRTDYTGGTRQSE